MGLRRFCVQPAAPATRKARFQPVDRASFWRGLELRSARLASDIELDLVAPCQHPIDDAEALRLLGRHEIVAVQRLLNFLLRLSGVLNVNLVKPALHFDDIFGMPFDVAGLTLEPA
jgi:hypothetical protein